MRASDQGSRARVEYRSEEDLEKYNKFLEKCGITGKVTAKIRGMMQNMHRNDLELLLDKEVDNIKNANNPPGMAINRIRAIERESGRPTEMSERGLPSAKPRHSAARRSRSPRRANSLTRVSRQGNGGSREHQSADKRQSMWVSTEDDPVTRGRQSGRQQRTQDYSQSYTPSYSPSRFLPRRIEQQRRQASRQQTSRGGQRDCSHTRSMRLPDGPREYSRDRFMPPRRGVRQDRQEFGGPSANDSTRYNGSRPGPRNFDRRDRPAVGGHGAYRESDSESETPSYSPSRFLPRRIDQRHPGGVYRDPDPVRHSWGRDFGAPEARCRPHFYSR
eukprot:TRINITY_DN48746_c0_g1_i1.p1 TRINITY_DN48746_c0_g1~~TRINITY_DN48746_c0_g1_i1.p1  ORF type:complete len:331 (+),score=8.52 TRINITY_DN48746_c0_g1_i1:69-1061(+)